MSATRAITIGPSTATCRTILNGDHPCEVTVLCAFGDGWMVKHPSGHSTAHVGEDGGLIFSE